MALAIVAAPANADTSGQLDTAKQEAAAAQAELDRVAVSWQAAEARLALAQDAAAAARARIAELEGRLADVQVRLNERAAALYLLLVAELTEQRTVPLHLPLPTEPRARALAERILEQPRATLDEVVATVPAARRTCERLLRDETGLTLAGWQRRARMLRAIELLGRGASVTTASAEVGYATPSAFVVAFRSETGCTPTEFMAGTVAGRTRARRRG